MQNRYFGDIGDYFKYGLLRELAKGRTLGVAWYLYPDEGHNADGKHIAYLNAPEKWRAHDPELFDFLPEKIRSNRRHVGEIENSGLLGKDIYAGAPHPKEQKERRKTTLAAKHKPITCSLTLPLTCPTNQNHSSMQWRRTRGPDHLASRHKHLFRL